MPTRYQDGAAGSHGFGTTDPTCLRGIRTGLQDLTVSDQRIQHAYKVPCRGCMISRVRITRSNMHIRHQDGTTGSHGYETSDRTCLQGIRMGLHDLTVSEHQIVHAYGVSGPGCRISRVRNTRSYMPTT